MCTHLELYCCEIMKRRLQQRFGKSTKMKKVTYEGCQLIAVATYGLKYLSDSFKLEATISFDSHNTSSYTYIFKILSIIGSINTAAKVWTKANYFTEVFVQAGVSSDIIEILVSKEVPFKILSQDLQEAIEKESVEQSRILARLKVEGKIVPWMAYYRLTDIYKFLDIMVAKYPARVNMVVIGRTHECRQIRALIIRGGRPGCKKIWIDGGVHAREWISTAVVLYIVNALLADHSQHGNVDFFITPVLNPDGYEFSHTTDRLWRNNRRVVSDDVVGVDINRSFGCATGEKLSSHDGKLPEVDKEVEQVMKFIRRNKDNMMGFVTFHNYSQLVLYPYGSEVATHHSDYYDVVRVGQEIAAAISSVNQKDYKAVEIREYCPRLQGNSVDWAKSEGIPYCYGIELRPSSSEVYPGFLVPHDEIIPTAEEAFAGVRKLVSVIAESQ